MRKRVIALLVLLLLLISAGSAFAQSYSFNVTQEIDNVFWNADGTESIDYVFVFANEPGGHVIDYVDVGIPNPNFDVNSIYADVNGHAVTDISKSGYQGSGNSGVAVGLGSYAIQPGQTGRVHVFIGKVSQVLYPDTNDSNYASADFSPTWFGSEYVRGSTDMTVTFHMPPGVKPEEPRWHQAPDNFPSSPQTALDDQSRPTYTWHNPSASASEQYTFGASFPKSYVPASAIVRPNPFAGLGTFLANSAGCLIPLGCIGFFAFIILTSFYSDSKRKLSYMPPRIAIEGHGIKRGLTAVEAATLMEQPVDKILTMILFSTIKKNAAEVVSRDPLQLKVASPLPDGLFDYEKDFLNAFQVGATERRKALQNTMVNLVKSVSQKMKGFSSRETVNYYQSIMKQAWDQVSAANTPEVKSQKFDEVMEWTMLDRNFNDRTREVFHQGPVFVPIWWGRYDPGFGRSTMTSAPSSGGSSSQGGGGFSMPTLPGGEFAAGVVGGIQNFSSKVVGNITDFTSGITQVTNPPPKPSTTSTYHGGGGGHCACACACACAGCACACAGGGR